MQYLHRGTPHVFIACTYELGLPGTNVAKVVRLASCCFHKVSVPCSNVIQLSVASFQHGIEVSSVLP